MKIDYAKRHPQGLAQGVRLSKRTTLSPTLPIVMVTFTLCVLLVGLIGYYYHRTHFIQAQSVTPELKTVSEFDFYQVLPELKSEIETDDPFFESFNSLPKTTMSDYFIQAGSFRTQDQAIQLVNSLQAQHYPAFWQAVTIPKQGSWFRVYIGPYAHLDQAKEIQFKLDGQLVPESFIIHPKDRGAP